MMGGPARLVFNPSEMLSYAGAIGSVSGQVQYVADGLLIAVSSAGDLPPGVLGAVQADVGSARGRLVAAGRAYDQAARDVRRAAQQAQQAGAADGSWVPLSAGTGAKILKHGGSIVLEIDKYVNGGMVHERGRRLIAAKVLADLAAPKAVQTALSFDAFRTAYRDAGIRAGDSALRRLRKTYQRHRLNGPAANIGGVRIGTDPETGRRINGLGRGDNIFRPKNVVAKRVTSKAAGLVPFAGTAADILAVEAARKAAKEKASVRNIAALGGSSLHVLADGAQVASLSIIAAPVALPVAVALDAAGTAIDVGVLAIDTAPIVADVVKAGVKYHPVAIAGRAGAGLVKKIFG